MSAIIAGLIPKIEGFQPIPNAVMIPFMEAQSAALAYGFGLNYEYGKRKVRSMSNDEFNSLTSEDITNMSNNHTHIILSKFQAQVPNVMPMQAEIFKQYVAIEKLKVAQNVELAKWVLQFAKSIGDDVIAHALGGHKHDEFTDPFVTDPNKFINPTTGEQGASVTDSPSTSTTTTTSISSPSPTADLFPSLTNTLSEAEAFTSWQANLILKQQIWLKNVQPIYNKDPNDANAKRLNEVSIQIAKISDDARNPNNGIRVGSNELRQEIANGRWYKVRHDGTNWRISTGIRRGQFPP